MLEPHRDEGFVKLRDHAAAAGGAAIRRTRHEQLGGLLGDRRAAFGRAPIAEVACRGPQQRNRIDAGVRPEAAILGGDRRVDDRLRQRGRVERRRPAAVAGARLVQQFAVAIVDERRAASRRSEKAAGERGQPNPRQHRDGRTEPGGSRTDDRTVTGSHRFTSMVAVAVRPEISGAYISSTCAGATRNDPAVVARTMYENSWWPPARRVANRRTRSSCRSTRSNVPRFHTSSQLGVSVPSCSSVCFATSAAVVLNQDSTGSKPAGTGSVTAT